MCRPRFFSRRKSQTNGGNAMANWQGNMKRHIVTCPHCGKEVLDHMIQCPFCKGRLNPRYYTGFRTDDQVRTLRRTMRIIGFAIAAILIVLMMLKRYG